MDDVLEEGLPEEGQDREAAATLAELASALSDAAAPEAGDGGVDRAAEAPPVRGRGLRRLFDRRPRLGLRHRLNPRRWTEPRLRLTMTRSRRPVAALMLVAALTVGVSGSVAPPNDRTSMITPPYVAVASPTAVPFASASVPASISPSTAPDSSATPSQSPSHLPPSPSGPRPTSPTATITFTSLMLDPDLGSSSARTFSFTSDGSGTVSAQVVGSSPMNSTELCVTADETMPQCDRGATPGLTQTSTGLHSHWTVSLVSGDKGSPTVDVQLSWPTDNPQITVNHARFQGYPNPDSLRTLSATFKARAAGKLSVDATWPPATADTTLTVTDVSSPQPTAVDAVAYAGATSISPAYSRSVKGRRTYKVELFNGGPDSADQDLKATIAFP